MLNFESFIGNKFFKLYYLFDKKYACDKYKLQIFIYS